MSEFKFTCPVCGQHIAADSSGAGAQIECPTCFQRIIVPQAPRPDSKYILSATQYIRPQQPSQPPASPPPGPLPRSLLPMLLAAAAALSVVGVALFLGFQNGSNTTLSTPPIATSALGDHAGNGLWRMDLSDASWPDTAAAGRLHRKPFQPDHAILQGPVLALRRGSVLQPDGAVVLFLPAPVPRDPGGYKLEIGTNSLKGIPRVLMLWKEGDLQVSQSFTNGYVMRLQFAQPTNETLAGRIFLCLPDNARSFVAGTFTAEVHSPSWPKNP